jgi:hypothetical protein
VTETVTIPRDVLEKVIDHLEEITGFEGHDPDFELSEARIAARAALSALREVERS